MNSTVSDLCVYTFLQHLSKLLYMVLSFQTDRSWQKLQNQIRLLLQEKSDQGIHYLLFNLHLLEELFRGRTYKSTCILECLQQSCWVSVYSGILQLMSLTFLFSFLLFLLFSVPRVLQLGQGLDSLTHVLSTQPRLYDNNLFLWQHSCFYIL